MRSGILKAFDWLMSRGLAQKYNPYHHPAGSPMGGKFAPKSMASGGNLIHVPYRGSQVHQMLVKRGLAEPKKPRRNSASRNSEFDSLDEAQTWVKQHLSENVDFGKKGLASVNALIKPLIQLSDTAPLGTKLRGFSLTKNLSRRGAFAEYINLGEGAIRVDPQFINSRSRKTKSPKALTFSAETEAAIGPYGHSEYRTPLNAAHTFGLFTNDSAGIVTHEYGHAWAARHEKEFNKHFGIKDATTRAQRTELAFRYRSTKYSRENWQECQAEAFNCYVTGNTQYLKPKMIAFFDKFIPKAKGIVR